MKKIAQFEKVSFEEFAARYLENNLDNIEIIKKIYNDIELPVRKTLGSAGYDFSCPYTVCIKKGESVVIPTGIRCKIEEGWVLKIYPRSSFGFKYHLALDNTVGIIDSDYYYADNEGHIMIKVSSLNNNISDIIIKKNECFAQGIFLEYGITYDDEVTTKRSGGIGSTSK